MHFFSEGLKDKRDSMFIMDESAEVVPSGIPILPRTVIEKKAFITY